MGAMASQITSLTIVNSTVYSDANQRKHKSSASLAFVRWIHRAPVNSPAQMASNAENVSISWRHHGVTPLNIDICKRIMQSLLHRHYQNQNLIFHFLTSM